MNTRQCLLKNIKKAVVKVGTSILTIDSDKIDRNQVKRIVRELQWLHTQEIKVILVSSGAIVCGMRVLGLKHRPKNLAQLQACAAVGQHKLMDVYEEFFTKSGVHIAQILLTADGLHSRQGYINARNTVLKLWDHGIVPVINENDTIATEEIKFGDNDHLSALVAGMVEADIQVVLSDVDGFLDSSNKVISCVEKIDARFVKLARGTNKHTSLGGMKTKLEAAQVVTSSGIIMVIANGHTKNIIKQIFEGREMGTIFLPQPAKMQAKKFWKAFIHQR